MSAGGQECPPHTNASYFDPQDFFENKSGNHRQNEEQPDPVQTIPGDVDVAIRVVDRDGLNGAILRQSGLGRREHTLPELSAQAERRYARQIVSDTNGLCCSLAS